MKKHVTLLSSLSAAFLFAACGDTVENVYQTGLEVFASEDDLPECTDKNEGELAFVKGEAAVRVCVNGEWEATSQFVKDTVYMESDVSCKTEELKDKSGLKIVCNGDSIGVVLNGADGKAGKDGKDGEDAVLPNDTLEADSERVPISLDSLVGVTQKGPFLKGSTVYLYELSDGRTLKQTNGNFTSNIVRDDGRYKFNSRDLVSQYAMVIVDGYYRNEVTGVSSNAPIRLKAITDMRKHSSVNVNILTHLEFERVYYLVTREKKTVKAAKRQAQKEILNLFHIELDDAVDAEDMDVFGSSEADAALLAISIMLQGDRTESEMIALLSEISNAIVENGKWDDAEKRAEIADWAFENDFLGKIADYRSYVEGWELSTTVPNFEKYVNQFWSGEMEKCSDVNEGEVVGRSYRNVLAMAKCENGVWNARALKDSRDGQDYRVIKIGDQVWMAENLNFKTDYSYCYKDEDSNCTKYGRLYRWAAAVGKSENECGSGYTCSLPSGNIQGVCPNGWHLPSKAEWESLFAAVGGKSVAGTKLKSTSGWENNNGKDGNGTDAFGFSALPAGYRNSSGNSLAEGGRAYVWSSTEGSDIDAFYMYLDDEWDDGFLSGNNKPYAFSVRCLKD